MVFMLRNWQMLIDVEIREKENGEKVCPNLNRRHWEGCVCS